LRNIDGIQVVGTRNETYIFVGYNRDFIIVDDKTDSIYINPTFDVFLTISKSYDDEYAFLKSCFVNILCQVPIPVEDFKVQYTKLHIAMKPPIDWGRVDNYAERTMSHILMDKSLDEFALDIYTALKHVCRDYPEEFINKYRDKMKGVEEYV